MSPITSSEAKKKNDKKKEKKRKKKGEKKRTGVAGVSERIGTVSSVGGVGVLVGHECRKGIAVNGNEPHPSKKKKKMRCEKKMKSILHSELLPPPPPDLAESDEKPHDAHVGAVEKSADSDSDNKIGNYGGNQNHVTFCHEQRQVQIGHKNKESIRIRKQSDEPINCRRANECN